MASDERTPYLKCLIHETKKVYKPWLIFVSAIGAAIGLGYVVWSAQSEILRIFEQIGNGFAAVQNALALVPWWLWIVIGIFVAPVIYAAVKCLFIRKIINIDRAVVFLWTGTIILLCASIIHKFFTPSDVDLIGLGIFGVGILLFVGGLILIALDPNPGSD